ncbi:MAG: YeeE/YedE thiosulfate transporter family protein [Gemmatimonadota bacterium]|jgi:uncharacterized protein
MTVGSKVRPAAYLDPYLAGVAIGLVLVAAYVAVGRGLGASGAFASVVASSAAAVGAGGPAGSLPLAPYLDHGAWSFAHDWLVFELVGVSLGGFAAAWQGGRFRVGVERGPNVSTRGRMVFAVLGGALMAYGARLARGCTSGQALTGGALLSVGAWIFILAAFVAGYAATPLVRRLWQ